MRHPLRTVRRKVLTVGSIAVTAPVEVWTRNGGTGQQRRVNSDGTVVGVKSGPCLDFTGAGTADGTPTEIWTCNGGSDQKWSRS